MQLFKLSSLFNLYYLIRMKCPFKNYFNWLILFIYAFYIHDIVYWTKRNIRNQSRFYILGIPWICPSLFTMDIWYQDIDDRFDIFLLYKHYSIFNCNILASSYQKVQQSEACKFLVCPCYSYLPAIFDTIYGNSINAPIFIFNRANIHIKSR